jgi:hypothetical protein
MVEGHHIVCGYNDGSLQLYSVFDWTLMYRLPCPVTSSSRGSSIPVSALVQLPDGRLAVGYDNGVVVVWRRKRFGMLRIDTAFAAHSSRCVSCVCVKHCLEVAGGNALAPLRRPWSAGALALWRSHACMAVAAE